ncbi:hypothetical protein BC629DRAFT_166615 [Irpex lacteus]|nr:hypothetical protein BC629DRAFT_166615 [Irpex lacteus]
MRIWGCHLTLHTFSHILSDERTQGIPLILETPAHDGKGKGKRKVSGSTEWEVWKKEVEVLGRIATLSQPLTLPLSESRDALDKKSEEYEQLLETWTEEIRGVVGRCGGAVGDGVSGVKKTTKSSAKNKGSRGRVKKVDEEGEEEGEEDMDMGE